MAKTIWKYEVPLGDGAVFQLTGPMLPHAELTDRGIIFWAEVSVYTDEPKRHQLRVVLTGEIIPESWQWVATAKSGGFVGHLYEVFSS